MSIFTCEADFLLSKTEDDKFRIDSTRFYFTYPGDIGDPETYLQWIIKVFKREIKHYDIAIEFYSDNKGKHTHAFIQFFKEYNLTDFNKANYNSLHPSIKSIISKKHVKNIHYYHLKYINSTVYSSFLNFPKHIQVKKAPLRYRDRDSTQIYNEDGNLRLPERSEIRNLDDQRTLVSSISLIPYPTKIKDEDIEEYNPKCNCEKMFKKCLFPEVEDKPETEDKSSCNNAKWVISPHIECRKRITDYLFKNYLTTSIQIDQGGYTSISTALENHFLRGGTPKYIIFKVDSYKSITPTFYTSITKILEGSVQGGKKGLSIQCKDSKILIISSEQLPYHKSISDGTIDLLAKNYYDINRKNISYYINVDEKGDQYIDFTKKEYADAEAEDDRIRREKRIKYEKEKEIRFKKREEEDNIRKIKEQEEYSIKEKERRERIDPIIKQMYGSLEIDINK